MSIAPQAAKTTLAKVLEAAETSSRPAGCVSALTPTRGSGAITSINGLPNPLGAGWRVSIDGGPEREAKRGTGIAIGDTIYLLLK